ncbi:MAG: lytic transglycosylase domain-containing protein, partial [Caulobacteraceae bacterium]
SAVAGYASLETHQPEGQGRLYVSARDAFYSGDAKAAHSLAVATGERWVAGLAAFRLKNFADARYRFDQVAADADEDPWLRAAGAYWAARSEIALGRPEAAPAYLRIAARWPRSFYGMLAESQLGYEPGAGERIPAPRVERRAEEDGPLIKAAFTPAPHADLDGMIARDDRAKRAAALMQVGRVEEASGELKKGFLTARSEQERGQWVALAVELNSDSQPKGRNQPPRYRDFNADDYPTPDYQPIGGYTVDRALVYALVKQESKFNPQVTSSAGAIGLMQVRPGTAADATGDSSFKYNARPLYDPAWNLRAGQEYIDFLQRRWTRYDMVRTVAAYNGGPGAVLKAEQSAGLDDSLMIVESLPAHQTREYVEKVMANYWTYRRLFGQPTRSLDALAGGAKVIDVRLDR